MKLQPISPEVSIGTDCRRRRVADGGRCAGRPSRKALPNYRPTSRNEPGVRRVAETPAAMTSMTLETATVYPRPQPTSEPPSLALALRVFVLALAVLLAWSLYRHSHADMAPAPVASTPAATVLASLPSNLPVPPPGPRGRAS